MVDGVPKVPGLYRDDALGILNDALPQVVKELSEVSFNVCLPTGMHFYIERHLEHLAFRDR